MSFTCATVGNSNSTQTILQGDPARVYTLTLRIRGVFGQKTYTGGVDILKYVNVGGSPAADNQDVVSLHISNPDTMYYLNKGNSAIDYNTAYDYLLTIQAVGNATLTLNINNQDNVQWKGDVNGNYIDVPGLGTYQGIFVQLTTEPSEPIVEYITRTGAGSRGWLWSGFIDNVYAKQADR